MVFHRYICISQFCTRFFRCSFCISIDGTIPESMQELAWTLPVAWSLPSRLKIQYAKPMYENIWKPSSCFSIFSKMTQSTRQSTPCLPVMLQTQPRSLYCNFCDIIWKNLFRPWSTWSLLYLLNMAQTTWKLQEIMCACRAACPSLVVETLWKVDGVFLFPTNFSSYSNYINKA